MNIAHIIKGWLKAMGVINTTPAEKALSHLRLRTCEKCPQARRSSVLATINGELENVDALFCNACHCPCLEKSLIVDEKCPLLKW